MSSPSPIFDAYMERAMQAQFEWHCIFAFRPVVTIDGRRLRFRFVQRRFQKQWVEQLNAYRPVWPKVAEYRVPT